MQADILHDRSLCRNLPEPGRKIFNGKSLFRLYPGQDCNRFGTFDNDYRFPKAAAAPTAALLFQGLGLAFSFLVAGGHKLIQEP